MRKLSRRGAPLLIQTALIAVLIYLGALLVASTAANLQERGIQSGFDFLREPAGFAIGESWLAFDSADSYLRAFLAGMANTVRVALPAIILSTLLGTLVGVGRLSRNLLVRSASTAFVEGLRNLPLLLQLLAWYFVLTDWLPPVIEAIELLPSVYLSKSGLSLPWPGSDDRWLELPIHEEFSISGGATLTPEFMALCLGLSLYTAAYVAETVRAGILAVPRGQTEAALALGMPPLTVFRQVVMPQALRSVIPPLTNSQLSLIKNSSLAVVVGYPDLVSIANTTLNQTGRAVECIVLIMVVYLLLSLLSAGFSRWFEQRSGRWADPR